MPRTSAGDAKAVTAIKHGLGDKGKTYDVEPGQPVDRSKFSEEEWQALIDAEAIDVGQLGTEEEQEKEREQGGPASPPPQ